MMVILLQCLKNDFFAKLTNYNRYNFRFHSSNGTFSYKSGNKDDQTRNLSIIYV